MPTNRVDSNTERILAGDQIQMPIVLSLASLRCRSASRITWHSHEVFEVLFLLNGETDYEFADGKTVALPGGHFMIVSPRTMHRGLHNVRRPARLCSILLNAVDASASINTIFTRAELDRLIELCKNAANLAWPMSADLRRLTLLLAQQVLLFESDREEVSGALRLTVCGTLLEMAKQLTVTRTIPPDEAVRAAIKHMEEKLDQSLSIDDVAKAIGCSRARLFGIFKQATGLTPNDYLQRMRVSKAADMLQETKLSITEIAMLCGFNTSQYFSNVFRKYHNQTPSDVRESGPKTKAKSKFSDASSVKKVL